jgi:hypothetical protein
MAADRHWIFIVLCILCFAGWFSCPCLSGALFFAAEATMAKAAFCL